MIDRRPAVVAEAVVERIVEFEVPARMGVVELALVVAQVSAVMVEIGGPDQVQHLWAAVSGQVLERELDSTPGVRQPLP